MGDALCKHNRSLGRQSLKDVEGFRSINASEIAPFRGDYLTGLESFYCCGPILDQLIYLIDRNDVQFRDAITAALPGQIKHRLPVNCDLILGSKIIAAGNFLALDLKLEFVFLVTHQIEERPDLRTVCGSV